MKKTLIIGTAIALFTASAVAQKMSLDKADEAIAYRKASFSLLAANFGDLAARVQGKKPFDAAIVASRVNNVSALAQLPWEAFAVAGSDQGDTNSKAAVWKNAAQFDAARDEFLTAVATLQAAGGDQKALAKAVGAVGKSCKACHSDFKS